MPTPRREYTTFELQAHILALLDKKIRRHNVAKCRMCIAVAEIGRKHLQEMRQRKGANHDRT